MVRNSRRRQGFGRRQRAATRGCLVETSGGFQIIALMKGQRSRLDIRDRVFYFALDSKRDRSNAESAVVWLNAGRVKKGQAKRLLIEFSQKKGEFKPR